MLVSYGSNTDPASVDSRVSHLVVDQDKVNVKKDEARQVPGRRIDDGPSR